MAPRWILNWRSIRQWRAALVAPIPTTTASTKMANQGAAFRKSRSIVDVPRFFSTNSFSLNFAGHSIKRPFHGRIAASRSFALTEGFLCLDWSCHLRQMSSRAVLPWSRIGLVRAIRRTKGLVMTFAERDIAARLGGERLTVRRDLNLRAPGPGIISGIIR